MQVKEVDPHIDGSNNTIDKKIHVCISAAGDGSVDTSKHRESFNMYDHIISGGDLSRSEIDRLMQHYDTKVVEESAKLSNERATTYQRFISKAISMKGGQIFHRIIKKKIDTTARPVAKDKLDTTADQDHANEQIAQWAGIWGTSAAEVDPILSAPKQ